MMMMIVMTMTADTQLGRKNLRSVEDDDCDDDDDRDDDGWL